MDAALEPDSTLLAELVAAPVSAEVLLAFEADTAVLLDRFRTGFAAVIDVVPDRVDGTSNVFPAEAVAPEPAPEDEPPVLDVAVADPLLP